MTWNPGVGRWLLRGLFCTVMVAANLGAPAFGLDLARQIATLQLDAVTNDDFGAALAATDDVVVVGAPEANGGLGAVYVYAPGATGWADAQLLATLTASDAQPSDRFGVEVTIDGDLIAVGAPFRGGLGFLTGAVYLFVRPATGWADGHQSALLTTTDTAGTGGDQTVYLGISLAISGSTVAAGASGTQIDGIANRGAVYLYDRPPGGWESATQTARMIPPHASTGAIRYGGAVSIENHVVAIGASADGSTGAVYLSSLDDAGAPHAEQLRLTPPDAPALAHFGRALTLHGQYLAVGAPFAAYAGELAGAVYLYSVVDWPAVGWIATLRASDPHRSRELGAALAWAGDDLLAGAPGSSLGRRTRVGAVYRFAAAAGWTPETTESQRLLLPAADWGQEAGWAVAGNAASVFVRRRESLGLAPVRGQVSILEPALDCDLPVTHDGLASVASAGGAACGHLGLTWPAATAACGGPIRYNVYRSLDAAFEPSVANLLASCRTATDFVDWSGTPGQRYVYAVIAEDLGGVGPGTCGGGSIGHHQRAPGGIATAERVLLFKEDLEHGSDAFALNDWALTDTAAASGSFSLYSGHGPWRRSWAQMAVPTYVPSQPATLEFSHRYATDSGNDGGKLFARADSLSRFHDILDPSCGAESVGDPPAPGPPDPECPRGGVFLDGGYNATLATHIAFDEFRGQPAWTGDSGPEFTRVRVDVSEFSGHEVTLRWAFGEDLDGQTTDGWYVDDVELSYGVDCAGVRALFADGFETGSVEVWSAAAP